MSKLKSRIVKIVLFPIIFYVLCLMLSVFLRDDSNAYTRILMHELHNQDKIDVLFCGASHVSHGILPSLMDERLNLSSFCTGTPSQGLFGTYAIIQDAVSFYDIKEIYLEMDFAVATSVPSKLPPPSETKNFLTTHYLKNKKVKFLHTLEYTAPSYYLNEILPIGKTKLIDLNPVVIARNIKSRLSGDYYKYNYKSKDSEYKGKGCVFDLASIENGTYSSTGEKPISVSNINENFKDIIRKIINLCKKENIKLVFYAQSNSDFYLCERGNYDEYYSAIKDFLNSEGYAFYDFNLCKESFLSFEDSDFFDSNHFNGTGIIKFTNAFCDFYNSNEKMSLFHESYAEKILSQDEKILGLSLREEASKKSVEIVPVLNHGNVSKVSYSVSLKDEEKTNIPVKDICGKKIIVYPENISGDIEIRAYYDGKENCHVTKYFVAL